MNSYQILPSLTEFRIVSNNYCDEGKITFSINRIVPIFFVVSDIAIDKDNLLEILVRSQLC